jgi:hypothetical protein
MSSDKMVPVLNGSRAVGILAGGQVYIPLPTNSEEAEALRGNLNSQFRAVLAVDRIHALAVALNAPRHVLHDPIAEREALEEEREQIRHEREIAELRRRKATAEAKIETTKVEQALEALEEFKERKFEQGRAGFDKRRADIRAAEAEAKLKEALARDEGEPEVIQPECKPDVRAPDLAQHFARLVDDLDEQIAEAESKGHPTEDMRAQQKLLNELMRKELLKGSRP